MPRTVFPTETGYAGPSTKRLAGGSVPHRPPNQVAAHGDPRPLHAGTLQLLVETGKRLVKLGNASRAMQGVIEIITKHRPHVQDTTAPN